MLPLLVLDILGKYPGMAGLFISAVFSASLSSMSTGLNSMSAVILEDFIKPSRNQPLTENQIHYILRFIVLIFGISVIGLVFVVEQMGLVLQLGTTLAALMNGPMLAAFFFGICVPWINTKSMLSGTIAGFICMFWICVKAQWELYTGQFRLPTKDISVEGCTYEFEYKNVTRIYE